jgi:RepB plasmid partitioning protein/ParB-like nuclease family protein
MPESVKLAFESQIVVLPLTDILLLRQVEPATKDVAKYKRILASIGEVGLVEPLVVVRSRGRDGRYLLLDGNLRHAALIDLGEHEARCLIAKDDEAFTYNKRVNRLATIQEHFMIVRALDRGVSEEKLAKALNVNTKMLRRRRTMLDGICPEVVDMLKYKSVDPTTFESLRKMKPMRQIEAAELMEAAGTFSSSYAKALLAATGQQDLLHPERPKKVGGMTPEQMARMEREMATLQRDFKAVEASYGDDVLHLVIASGYLSKLIGNTQTSRYLGQHHPEILDEFKAIVGATSLDQTGANT